MSQDGLFVNTEGMGREGAQIYAAAEFAEQLNAWTRAACPPEDKPWGVKGEYAEQMEKNVGGAKEDLYELLDLIGVALRQLADGTLQSNNGFHALEDVNVDSVGNIGVDDLPGGRR
ncbi:hypothetical protein [Nocardiopsis lambiniae]|uniref:Nucleotide pyrophosphohydrolase n=1 Tax=Nocardiopsis lambiniae TaxID=3075539 RepID=A0ABU2MF57_9ACTN|nr:hypothetical protein [Nocardiopsis sp. DSM 44743]MDT0331165.1 hypothetical protein [Nocardiopsis sp. DSM 44743]